MKFLLYTGLILLIAFIIVQIFAMSSQKNIETYPYKVVKSVGNIEIRAYEASLFSSVRISSDEYEKASSAGFSKLANFIFGGNDKNESIAMTSPVAMSLEDSMKVMFMVPKKYNKETLPTPNASDITIEQVPAKTVAAITFGGWANSEKNRSTQKRNGTSLGRE